jgi:16S rRNA (cytosine1402-N4)-methyltransferase
MSDSAPPRSSSPPPHTPVLARQVVELLAPRDAATYLDGTFGAGGHTRLILQAANCRVIGLDRDQTAIALGAGLVESGRLVLMQSQFSDMEVALCDLAISQVDGVLLDVGVSSMQLDQAERGFSFRQDGPLDMRMGGEGPSAADVVALASPRQLAAIIGELGEERYARAVANAIVETRSHTPIVTTSKLAEIVARVVRHKPGEIHPATRTFQALRIFVNDELAELVEGLHAAERVLAPGGRLLVISFHSLEDRIVKRFLADRSRMPAVSRYQPLASHPARSFRLLTRHAVVADETEIAANPRARSAKLRAAERTDAGPLRSMTDLLPDVPSLADVMKGGR